MAGTTKIQVVITAVDNATKNILKVSNSLNKLTQPFTRLNRSMAQFSRAAGLTKVTDQLGAVYRAAGRVGDQFRAVFGHLAAITGFGSLAGLAAVAVQWGKIGFEVARTSFVLGVSTDQLQRWRNASIATGGTADDATQAIASMGQTLEDATYGRNQQALVLMNRLGISLHRTKDGAVDSSRALRDLSRALADPRFKGNRQAQSLVANTFGAGSLLPLLLRGPQAVDAAMQQGPVMNPAQIKAAESFEKSLIAVRFAAEGLRNTLGSALLPVVQPLVERFAAWVDVNKDLIATNITKFVNTLVENLPKILKGVNDVADAFGGWKNVAIGFGVVMAASVLAPIASLAVSLIGLTTTIIPAFLTALGGIGMLLPKTLGVGGLVATGTAGAFTSLGLVGGAGLAGYGVGSLLYNGLIKGTGADDAIGGGVANFLGNLGVGEARNAVSTMRNNPGGLRFPGTNRFRNFDSAQDGTDAMATQLLRYYTGKFNGKKIDTLEGIISTWAPATDRNDVPAYLADVSQRTGFGAKSNLNLSDSGTLSKIIQGMAGHENTGTGVTAAMADSAAKKVIHVEVSAPAGMRASVRGADSASARVQPAMPSMDTP